MVQLPSGNRLDGRRARRGAAGFTLVELLVAMGITTVILGATMVAMNDAVKANDAAMQLTNLNGGLRTAMDLMVRDVLQTGQGLPTGRVIGLPNGTGSTAVILPGPIGSEYYLDGPSFCPPDPNDPTPDNACEQVSAVVPGPGRGPELSSGVMSDMITILAADSSFERVRLTNFASNGNTVTVLLPVPAVNPTNGGANITDGGPDDVERGDLMMLVKGSNSLLLQVTGVSGQVITFGSGDSLNLNQTAAAAGTRQQFRNLAPADTGPVNTELTRIRMISYYLDIATDSTRPRLIRRMNNGDPTNFDNSLGTVVAFDVENLRITYDLADGVTNPTNVRMDDDDLGGTGACAPRACSPNQIRKVNLMLSARSRRPLRTTRAFFHNTLVTQVSLRSLAFVDEYR